MLSVTFVRPFWDVHASSIAFSTSSWSVSCTCKRGAKKKREVRYGLKRDRDNADYSAERQ
jgi:hypothetical protein